MADTATPPVIRRADYAPPAFLIDTVALEFDLVPERTVVRNTMRVRRNPDAAQHAGSSLLPMPRTSNWSASGSHSSAPPSTARRTPPCARTNTG
jgi:hypothetical protein